MNNNRQPDNVKKAQADSSPELSSVLRELKNGIDIQPLDDVQQGEFVEFEDNVTDTNQEEKEAPEPVKQPSDKKELWKKYGRAAVVVLLVIGVLAGIYFAFFRLDDFTHGAVAVYEKDSGVTVMLEKDD